MKINDIIHPDFLTAQKLFYEPSGLICDKITVEKESKEYGACTFTINDKNIVFRVAKITPTKIGQFLTLWKRIDNSPIMPFDITDPIDLFVVNVRKDGLLGQFVFPKNVLVEKGFVSINGIGGKRAMRVYPPWEATESVQAKKTQAWQLMYFLEIQPTVEHDKIKKLFS